jgi:tetrahydromethanopterin S-methyltransferase subunit G
MLSSVDIEAIYSKNAEIETKVDNLWCRMLDLQGKNRPEL